MTTIPKIITKDNWEEQAKELLKRANEVNQEIKDSNLRFKEEMDVIEEKVGESVKKIEKLFSEMDKLEEDAGNEMDKLMLEQSESMADESDEDDNIEDEDDVELGK